MTEFLLLLPLLLTLVLALTLKNTLLALGAGIVTGAVVFNHFQWLDSFQYLSDLMLSQFYSEHQWHSWHIDIMLTMFLLGIMVKLLSQSQAVVEFSGWLQHKVRTQRQARLGVIFLGWFVFIDGIFSCLTVGHISQSVSERYRISPARLAYFVDTTASPITSLIPISSWGPFVISLLAGLTFLQGNGFQHFIDIAQTNLYAIVAVLLSLYVAWSGIGFNDKSSDILKQDNKRASEKGNPWLLTVPILTLLLGSVILILWSGASHSNSHQLSDWLASADVGSTMRNASALSVTITVGLLYQNGTSFYCMLHAMWLGIKSISFAVTILIFTWLIGGVISDLNVAQLLAHWADIYLSKDYLLGGLFLLCALMAFATGSSWGTFAIMIPIGGEIAHILSPELIIPSLSAVMAGSVFGDHCSPISDTTVISATSSGCTPYQHVTTQLPFALIAAFSAFIGFQLINFKLPYWLALSAAITLAYAITCFIYQTGFMLRSQKAQPFCE